MSKKSYISGKASDKAIEDFVDELIATQGELSPDDFTKAVGEDGGFFKALSPEKVKEFFKRLVTARKETNTNPTEAQKESGNYAKGTITVHGLEIAIENPKGSYRIFKDKNSVEHKSRVAADYGYFKTKDASGTQVKGNDKDEVDCFIGDDPKSEKVFIINQINAENKKFDESKCMMCFSNKSAALKAYKGSYSDNALNRIGSMSTYTLDEFKEWLKSGDKKVPA